MLNRIVPVMIAITLLSMLVPGTGCSNRPSGMPSLYPCKITVTQDGAPLADARVTMVNISDTETGDAWTPAGMTDSSGVAVMRTNNQYDGAAAGTYRIVVEKIETEPSRLGAPPPADSPEYEAWADKSANENLAQYALVEATYSSSKTPHEIEVAKGSNEKTVDVGKAVKIKM